MSGMISSRRLLHSLLDYVKKSCMKKARRVRFLAAAMVLGIATTAYAQAYDFSEVTRLANGALVGNYVNDPIPGFEILILRNGQSIYHQAFGMWTKGQVAKIDSASKTISAAVLMSLTERSANPFTLDTKLSDYLPAYNTADKRFLTIRQSFSHTSGLDPGTTFWALFAGDLTLRQSSTWIALEPLLYVPGAAFAYGSISMQAAGAAAEAAAGIPFADLLAERITQPLKMENTRFYLASQQNPRVDGGLESTAAEFSRFMDLLLLEGVDRVEGRRLLSVASVREMLTRQTTDALPTLSSPLDNNRYAIGTWVNQFGAHGSPVPAWAAGGRGFNSWIEPSRGVVLTFATDLSSRANIMELSSRIHAAVLRAVPSLAETGMGVLENVVIEAILPEQPPLFTGDYRGGYPLGTAHLQASRDLGVTDAWTTVFSTALDGFGKTTFHRIPDSRPGTTGFGADFFRVLTKPASE